MPMSNLTHSPSNYVGLGPNWLMQPSSVEVTASVNPPGISAQVQITGVIILLLVAVIVAMSLKWPIP
jgi:hypothetical protein